MSRRSCLETTLLKTQFRTGSRAAIVHELQESHRGLPPNSQKQPRAPPRLHGRAGELLAALHPLARASHALALALTRSIVTCGWGSIALHALSPIIAPPTAAIKRRFVPYAWYHNVRSADQKLHIIVSILREGQLGAMVETVGRRDAKDYGASHATPGGRQLSAWWAETRKIITTWWCWRCSYSRQLASCRGLPSCQFIEIVRRQQGN